MRNLKGKPQIDYRLHFSAAGEYPLCDCDGWTRLSNSYDKVMGDKGCPLCRAILRNSERDLKRRKK